MDIRVAVVVASAGLVSASVSALGQGCGASLGFTEVAVSVGIDFEHDGLGIGGPVYYMSSGGVAGDFNNDGWPDLFVLATGSRADALYINQGNGTFVDEAAAWGVDGVHFGVGAAAADINGDGWLDIYVTSHSPEGAVVAEAGRHRLYRNNGDGTFTDIAVSAGVNTTSASREDGWGASFGDFDLDGDLDLAVAGWHERVGGEQAVSQQRRRDVHGCDGSGWDRGGSGGGVRVQPAVCRHGRRPVPGADLDGGLRDQPVLRERRRREFSRRRPLLPEWGLRATGWA